MKTVSINLKNNIKETWKLIKKIISNTGKTTSSSGVDELLINSKITKDKSQIANKFNEYFTNIGSGLATKIPPVSGDFRKYVNNGQSFNQSFFAQPTDRSEIIDLVKLFKSNNSAGFDDIHPSAIKNLIF